jgi:hypothetical protein
MKYFLLIPLLFLTGCVHVKGTRSPDGTLTVSTTRFLWTSEGIAFSLKEGTNGILSTTLAVKKSSPDDAALAAIVQGAVQGAIAGMK